MFTVAVIMDIDSEAVMASAAVEQAINDGSAVGEQQRPPMYSHPRRGSDLGQRLLLGVVTTLLKPRSRSCFERTSWC